MSKGNPAERLEDELDRAKARGRWLSDDEQAALDREADAEALLVEAKQQRDRKLMILTGVCLLIPPLWPVALGLTLFLLYPDTMARDRAGGRHHLAAWRIAVGRRARFGDGLADSVAVLIRCCSDRICCRSVS